MLVRGPQSFGGRLFDVVNHVGFFLLCITFIYPFWTILVTAFEPIDGVYRLGLHIWPKEFRTESWIYIFSRERVGLAYYNTLFRVVIGTLFILLVTFTGAYALSKRDLPGRGVITFLYVLTLFFSGGLVPTYLLIREIGLINSRWALILPVGINAFYIVIARNFLMTIDQAMEDSAVIDGASYWKVLIRIVVPLARPAIAVIALWAAVQHWNAWFDALIYTPKKELRVLQLLVRDMITLLRTDILDRFTNEMGAQNVEIPRIPPEAVKAATIIITIGPIILVYPFIQKYFVRGVMLGSVKG